jgi:3-oxoacyl-[acyl-carrier-protein] synthase-3
MENAGITADRDRPDPRGHDHAGHVLPEHFLFRAAQARGKRAACFDVSAACAGFLYALEIAQQFITSHTYDTILVIGAEKLSSIVDWTDRNTCVLFGDGAGAAILRHRGGGHGVVSTFMGSDGGLSDILYIRAAARVFPSPKENADQRLNCIKMNGKETYKHAVISMLDAAHRALSEANLKPDDLACIIPHQANLRIIEAIAHRMGLPMDRFMVNLDRYGNTSAAAVAIALDEAHRTGRMQVGDYVLLVVFGGGLTGRVPSFSGEESRLVFADRAVPRRNGLHRYAFRFQRFRFLPERFEFLFLRGLKLLLQFVDSILSVRFSDLQPIQLLGSRFSAEASAAGSVSAPPFAPSNVIRIPPIHSDPGSHDHSDHGGYRKSSFLRRVFHRSLKKHRPC